MENEVNKTKLQHLSGWWQKRKKWRSGLAQMKTMMLLMKRSSNDGDDEGYGNYCMRAPCP